MQQFDFLAVGLVGPYAETPVGDKQPSVFMQGKALRTRIRRSLHDAHDFIAFDARQPTADHLNDPQVAIAVECRAFEKLAALGHQFHIAILPGEQIQKCTASLCVRLQGRQGQAGDQPCRRRNQSLNHYRFHMNSPLGSVKIPPRSGTAQCIGRTLDVRPLGEDGQTIGPLCQLRYKERHFLLRIPWMAFWRSQAVLMVEQKANCRYDLTM